MTREIVEETISAGFDQLDARLSRIGYTPKTLADLTDTHLSEMRRFLKGKLEVGDARTRSPPSCARRDCRYERPPILT